MKKLLALSIASTFFISCQTTRNTDPSFEDFLYEVRMSEVFADSKIFADATFVGDTAKCVKEYFEKSSHKNFSLKDFVYTYFDFDPSPTHSFKTDKTMSVKNHINTLWPFLLRKKDSATGSRIALPNPYVVPGGRFKEIYYWDSYFTILGLIVSGKWKWTENMIDNFAYLINTYGFIPNGSRNYYLTRSQPPFFCMMVQELAFAKKEDKIYLKYFPALLKEYQFWMDGRESLSEENPTSKHTILYHSCVLNRYFDKGLKPRIESYKEDVLSAQKISNKENFYSQLRSACESGWDFSSRWLEKPKDLSTIRTKDIIPVDLNCLMYKLEKTIAYCYRLKRDKKNFSKFDKLAKQRKIAIQKYFWNKEGGYFTDIVFTKNLMNIPTLAGAFPLYVGVANYSQSISTANFIQKNFLKPGGLITTMNNTGQQWDAPNGWAPLHWVVIQGLLNYKQDRLASEIARRWKATNDRVFRQEGKMMEKYNVVDTTLVGGGGEYTNQDGFGWTNGVYLKILKEFNF